MHPSINPDYFTGKKKNQGFSLVEALVGVAVAGLILTFLVSLSSQSIRVIQSMEASKSHRQDAREILHLISQDLQGALFPLDSSDLESYQMIKNPPFLNQNLLNRDALFWQTTSDEKSLHSDVVVVGYFIRWINDPRSPCPVLCRLYVNPDKNNDDLLIDSPQEWVNDSLLSEFSPATAAKDYRGYLADNVIGLWIELQQSQDVINGSFRSDWSVFDSRKESSRPKSAKVSLAMVTPEFRQQLDFEMQTKIQGAYSSSSPQNFIKKLPVNVRKNVRIFSVRVDFKNI